MLITTANDAGTIPRPLLDRMEVIDVPSYLFDEKMSREEIAYESHDFPKAEEGFYGDHWWRVLFNYDNAGKVESIAYAISPN